MKPEPAIDITQDLLNLSDPDIDQAEAMQRLTDHLYEQLSGMAVNFMRRERIDHTLQPTALVHEVYLRLVDQPRVDLHNRAHFLGIAGRTMRRILVEHARRRGAHKRGGDWKRTNLDASRMGGRHGDPIEMIALDRALINLSARDEKLARVAEMRLFAGASDREIAQLLEVSQRTVQNYWAVARMWLSRELSV